MANYNRSEEARRNRMAAMVDDGEAEIAAAKTHDQFEGRKQLREACAVRLDRIIADPDQPRKDFDEDALARLAESLRTRGQLQPIRIRWDQGRGVYVVVVGERRWRAARLAGLDTISCVVVSGAPTAADLLEDQLVENAVREGLKPVEQAKAFRTLMDGLGLTQLQLASKLQISQATVSQSLSLLELVESAQSQVDSGDLAPSIAYQIAKVQDPDEQRDLAARVVNERMSRADAVEAVRRVAAKAQKGRGESRGGTSKGNPTGEATKGKPTRLPAEIKFRGPAGSRVAITTTAKQTMADVLADLEAFAAKVRTEIEAEARDAGQAA
jgi:ParB family chromosome partitioning protein